MAKSLILVESQQKFQTLKTFLTATADIYNINGSSEDGGTEYMQHLIFNEPAELSFLGDTKIQKLITLMHDSDSVYLATSPDLIGDALAWQLVELVGPLPQPPQRLFLPTLSKQQLCLIPDRKKIFAPHSDLLDQSIQMDGAFDYHVRRALNVKRAKRPLFGLAAALALNMICHQDATSAAALQQPRLALNVLLKKNAHQLCARLVHVNGQPASIIDKHTAKALIADIKKHDVKIGRMSDKKMTTAPPLPLTTAKLIAVAERYLGFNARHTMAVARSLYNGCDIGLKNPAGLITHPVTDSLYCPDADILTVREYIIVNYGKTYVPEKPRLYSKNSASPFSIIRPTQVTRMPKKMRKYLTMDQYQLYDLIWTRFVASQMADAEYTRRKVTLYAGPAKRFVFQVQENQTTSRGYLQIYPNAANKSSFLFGQEFQRDAVFEIHGFDIIKDEKHTDFIYTEGLLLEALGELDACLSETLEFIPDVLKQWMFIQRTKEGALYPTKMGKEANATLQRRYPDIISDHFIRRQKRNIITAFHSKKRLADPVDELLKLLQNSSRPVPPDVSTTTGKKTRQKCPVCGDAIKFYANKAGDFLVCEHYPESCQYYKAVQSYTHRFYGHCPECDAELTVKIGQFGRFLACSKFPKCTFTKPFTTGAYCPNEGCNGEIIERTTPKGRIFYGCSKYPHCHFSSWQFPINMACPACGNLYVVAKTGESADHVQCPKCRNEFDANLVAVKKS